MTIPRWIPVAFLVLSGCAAEDDAPHTPAQATGATENWQAQAQAGISNGEYAPQAEGEAFRVTNRAQDLQVQFEQAGLQISDRQGGPAVGLSLRAWGREGAVAPAEAVLPEEGACLKNGATDAFGECLHSVNYPRPGLTESWENTASGLEQGFVVTAPPEGEGALVFELALKGALADVSEEEALLVREVGVPLRFSGLAAWDERGHSLPAWMEESDDGLRLMVDDTGAIGTITIDPLLTTLSWRVESDQEDANFGNSVASAGDVNGDGYGDVIVGAYYYDNNQVDEGRAFVYLGSASGLSTTASWSAESDQDFAYFGVSVSAAGDVNGDGYGDVIVGANCYENVQSCEGRAFVYLGSATGLSTTASWTAESDQAYALFGISVSSAGDVNGDGYGDVIVGAYAYNNGIGNEGRVFVYLGSASGLSTTASWTAESNQANEFLGTSVASAGDVNGDGYGDVIVGASGYNGGQVNEGRVYVYPGSSTGLSTASWTIESNQAGARFGASVASAGDVNGDGYGDVIVGALYYSNGQSSEGRAFVYLGSSTGMSTVASWSAESDQVGAGFGASVASAGDVNGDGYGDVIVGAFGYDNGETDEGRAFMYLGSATGLSTTASWTAESDQVNGGFGRVSSAGDVNGDGYGDVIVGASAYDNGQNDEGCVFVYLGAASNLSTTTSWTGESNQASARFGFSVASAGDVNGDGYGDVIVGAFSYSNGQNYEGRAFVYLGSATGLSTTASWTAESDQVAAYFGYSVASAGDVNGDGYGDVIVGAYLYDNGQMEEGRAYVYLGSASGLSTTASWTAESDQASVYFGLSAASAGDVNGDGYGDVIVGAYAYSNGQNYEGRAYVYLGSATGLSTTANWIAESDQVSAYFGYSVGSAGDVNGDGYSDVIIGAYLYDNGQMNEGSAFVYLGSSTGPATTASWIAESDQVNAFFGYSVASAGDVNRDGYGDVIVGAQAYNNGQTDEGRAYVYLGSATGLSTTASWTTESNQVSAYFSWSVASAGDVNGDGYGDVIVGAMYYDNGQTNEGRAFVYLGSATGPSTTASWSAEANQVNAEFGWSVASAGDVNGDGYGDVIVGAREYDNGQAEEGRAFVYLGNGADGTTPLALASQARQSGLNTPIVAGLASTSTTAFDVAVIKARGPWGRSNVKVQVEAKALGIAFDGSGLQTQSSYTSSGLTGASIQQGISGLSAGTAYHWRARVLVSPAEGHPQGWGPWMYGGLSGNIQGAHVFTAGGNTFYADTDGDGYGNAAVSIVARGSAVAGYVSDATDCNDASASIYPGATEVVADSVDQDCNSVDSCYTDADGDNYGATVVVDGSSLSCVTGSGAAVSTDCNDAMTFIYPGATEIVGDNIDQSCDGSEICYMDADSDGYRPDSTSTVISVNADCADAGEALAVAPTTDCNDAVASIYPGATEVVGDNIDQSCDGSEICYLDADSDGYRPDSTSTVISVNADCTDAGEALAAAPTTDCNDALASIHPAATEICDAANTDENCNGLSDDADSSVATSGMSTFFVDADGDGYGSTTTALYCDLPVGYSLLSTDCNDNDIAYNPAALETDCTDPNDYNCDGSVSFMDADNDGFAACEDCNDNDGNINADATETAGDGVDQNCDGLELCFVDADNDGYSVDNTTLSSTNLQCNGAGEADANVALGDCNDNDVAYHPSAAETDCTDPNDYNCDGSVGFEDADNDGFAACEDCNDNDGNINADASETAGDGVDQNCDGLELCFVDADNDGYSVDNTTLSSTNLQCDGAGEADANATLGDCNDNDIAYNPAALETDCTDPNDYNCDGSVQYADADADGFAACMECDDNNEAVHPEADEICNGVDDNCDGEVDVNAVDALTWQADADGDGFTNPDDVVTGCEAPTGYIAATEADCDDADANVFPGNTEIPNDAIDQDCDGSDLTINDTAPPDDSAVIKDSGKEGKACGCAMTEGASTLWFLALGALALSTRRRAV